MPTTYPRKDRNAKSGWNLEGAPVLAHRAALPADRWIVAGSEEHVDSAVDDMHSHVDAVVWWQMQKLTCR